MIPAQQGPHKALTVALDSRVDGVVGELIAAWARTWDTLAPLWAQAARAAAEDPTASRLRRADRYAAALEATRTALEDLIDMAGATMTTALPDLVTDAATGEVELITAGLPGGSATTLGVSWDRIDPAALDAIITRATEQITSLAWPIVDAVHDMLGAQLAAGIAAGDNPRVVARRIAAAARDAVNMGLDRALTIARTEMLDAHRAATAATDRAHRDVVAHWEWEATLDRRTCGACLSMHGRRFDLDEDGPDGHQQCRCARNPVTKSWRELGFDLDEPPSITPDARTWFDSQPVAVQRDILGPGVHALYASGVVSWEDLAVRRSNPGWRDSVVPARLVDLQPA